MEKTSSKSSLKHLGRDPYFHVYIATVVVLMLFTWFFFISRPDSILPIIVIVGAGGGVISTYMRITSGKLTTTYDRATLIPTLQVYISPFVAGMLALLFHGFMAAQIMTGPLFPHFKNGIDAYSNVENFLTSFSPSTNSDAAKAIVWAFVAGFSERLVPNVLDTLSKVKPKDNH